jgi:hypothetical protein
MNIFNLSTEYLQLMSEIEELDGELTPELEERLSINQDNVRMKLKAYRYIKLMLDGDINVIDNEIERLSALKKSKNNTIDRIKETMLNAVLIFGDDGKSGNKKMDYPDFKLWTTNRQVLNIEREEEFNNPDYIKISIGDKLNWEDYNKIKQLDIGLEKVSTSISRTELLADLKLGVEVEGAEIKIKPSLTVK